MKRVVITGLGIVSCLGNNQEEVHSSLLNSKSGITFAEEYKEQGIAFNVLALGAVQTEMLEEAFPGYQAPLSAQEMAAYIKNFALTGNAFYNGKVLQVSASTP